MKIIKFFVLLLAISLVRCTENTDFLPQSKNVKTKKRVALRASRMSLNDVSPKKWLQAVPDNVYISQLSIPGTHESAALHEPLPNIARCQWLDIPEQLNIGVRYLDIRCRHFKNKFTIHHGPIYQHKNFSDILKICKQFLKENPSEFIIMSIKQEHKSAENNRYFYETFMEYAKNEATGIFYTKNVIPTVETVRGKIVLIRRFGVPEKMTLGIQAYNGWNDNRNRVVINNETNTLIIQDKYKFKDNKLKWNLIKSHFEKSFADKNIQHLYINNSSGYKPGWFGIPNITAVSNEINNKLGLYLYNTSDKKKKLGIVGIDFIGDYRAKQIYTMQDF